MNPFPALEWSIEAISLAFGIVVIIAVLGYAAYLLSQLSNTLSQFFKRYLSDFDAQDKLRAKQKEWFAKYANIILKKNGAKARTVTMTRFVIDAIDVNRPMTISKREAAMEQMAYAGKSNAHKLTSSQRETINQYLEEDDCELDDYNLAELVSWEQGYENFCEELGIGLGGICICGGGYCDWEADIFDQFIVDLTKWNFKGITIYKNGVEISRSLGVSVDPSTAASLSLVSPGGRFLLVRLDQTAALQSLAPGDVVKVVFEWCDENGNLRCAVIYNGIPGATEFASNGQAEVQSN